MELKERTQRKAFSTRSNNCTEETECISNHYETVAPTSVITLKAMITKHKHENKQSSDKSVDNFEQETLYDKQGHTETNNLPVREINEGSIKKKLKCKFCFKAYKRLKYLLKHMKSHKAINEETENGDQTDELINDDFDRIDSNNETAIETNSNKHSDSSEPTIKPHKCQYCTKTFTRRNCLLRHTRTHTGERPYECSICERRFVEHGAMRVHYRIHTGERPFVCSYCSRSFRHKSNLTLHERWHFNDKRYKCPLCSKTFISPGNCKKHERTHSKEKKYKCERCFLSFKTDQGLSKHLISHHDSIHKCKICLKDSTNCKKPMIKCELCEKTFTKASSLKIHYRTHTGEKPYRCELCLKTYGRCRALMKHQKLHK